MIFVPLEAPTECCCDKQRGFDKDTRRSLTRVASWRENLDWYVAVIKAL